MFPHNKLFLALSIVFSFSALMVFAQTPETVVSSNDTLIEERRSELKEIALQQQGLLSSVEELKSQKAALEAQLADLKTKVIDTLGQTPGALEEMKREILKLDGQVKDKNELINALIEEKASLARELPLVRQERTNLRQTVDELSKKVEYIEGDIKKAVAVARAPLETQINTLNQQLSTTQAMISQIDKIKQEKKIIEEKNSQNELVVKKLNEALARQKSETQNVVAQGVTLNQELSQAISSRKALEAKLNDFTKQHITQQVSRSNLLEQVQNDKGQLNEKIVLLSKQSEEQAQRLASAVNAQQKAEQQLGKLTVQLKEKADNILRKEQEIARLTQENNQLEIINKQNSQELGSLQQQLASTHAQLKQVQELSQTRDEKIKKFAGQLVALQQERDVLSNARVKLENQLKEISANYTKLQAWADSKDKAFNELKLDAAKNTREAQHQQQQLNQQVNALNKERESTLESIGQLTRSKEELTRSIEGLKLKAAEKEEALKQSQTVITQTQTQLNKEKETLIQTLGQIQEEFLTSKKNREIIEQQLQDTRGELDKSNQQRQQAVTANTKLTSELNEIKKTAKHLAGQLKESDATLAKVQAELQTRINEFDQQMKDVVSRKSKPRRN